MRKTVTFILLAMLLVSCNVTENIPFVQSGDGFYINFNDLSASDEHRMELKNGDSLAVAAEIENGSMHLAITSPSGEKPYAGNLTEKNFTVNVHEDGTYLFYVKVSRLTGKLEVRKIKEE